MTIWKLLLRMLSNFDQTFNIYIHILTLQYMYVSNSLTRFLFPDTWIFHYIWKNFYLLQNKSWIYRTLLMLHHPQCTSYQMRRWKLSIPGINNGKLFFYQLSFFCKKQNNSVMKKKKSSKVISYSERHHGKLKNDEIMIWYMC